MGEHVHVLEDGTVVKHSHTHTHENTKAVINLSLIHISEPTRH